MKDPVIWHVIFHPREKGDWWARRFSHVSLAGWTNETWIHLDLGRSEVDLRAFYAHDDVNDYLSSLLTHYTVVKFGAVDTPGQSFMRPLTCVSFVKHVLGVRSRALLPDQLFRILKSQYGAETLNEGENCRGNGGTTSGQATV